MEWPQVGEKCVLLCSPGEQSPLWRTEQRMVLKYWASPTSFVKRKVRQMGGDGRSWPAPAQFQGQEQEWGCPSPSAQEAPQVPEQPDEALSSIRVLGFGLKVRPSKSSNPCAGGYSSLFWGFEGWLYWWLPQRLPIILLVWNTITSLF